MVRAARSALVSAVALLHKLDSVLKGFSENPALLVCNSRKARDHFWIGLDVELRVATCTAAALRYCVDLSVPRNPVSALAMRL